MSNSATSVSVNPLKLKHTYAKFTSTWQNDVFYKVSHFIRSELVVLDTPLPFIGQMQFDPKYLKDCLSWNLH